MDYHYSLAETAKLMVKAFVLPVCAILLGVTAEGFVFFIFFFII